MKIVESSVRAAYLSRRVLVGSEGSFQEYARRGTHGLKMRTKTYLQDEIAYVLSLR